MEDRDETQFNFKIHHYYLFILLHFAMDDPVGQDMGLMSVRLHFILAVHQLTLVWRFKVSVRSCRFIFWRKFLIKVVQWPQKSLRGSNQIWAVTSNEQDMRPATSAYIPQRHISNSRTRQKVLISSIKWNIIKPDFWVRTYRIIFGMFNTLCKIIENRSFLLILQLPSFQ